MSSKYLYKLADANRQPILQWRRSLFPKLAKIARKHAPHPLLEGGSVRLRRFECQSHTRLHTHFHTFTHKYTHTHSHTHTHTRTFTHSHTQIRTRTHTRTLAHSSLTHTPSRMEYRRQHLGHGRGQWGTALSLRPLPLRVTFYPP